MKNINLRGFEFLINDFITFNKLQDKVARSGQAFVTVIKEVHKDLKTQGFQFTENVETFCKTVNKIQGKTLSKLGHNKTMQRLR